MKIQYAIVKTPCQAMVDGLTTSPELGKPDYEKALEQHQAYIAALEQCGAAVTVLPADEAFPDSCFVEDPIMIAPELAIITNPAKDSRFDEKLALLPTVKAFVPEDKIETIHDPGTLEGDDIMRAEDQFFIGRSARTNKEGIKQFKAILAKYGFSCTEVNVENVLQLKTGVCYLGDNKMLTAGEFVGHPAFAAYDTYEVPAGEEFAANCLSINDTIIVPEGYPKTLALIQSLGFKTITVDISEFRKLDGGLSSLSIRF